jgi:hypothetical protein
MTDPTFYVDSDSTSCETIRRYNLSALILLHLVHGTLDGDKKEPQLSICDFIKIVILANYLMKISSECCRHAKPWLQPQDQTLMGEWDYCY